MSTSEGRVQSHLGCGHGSSSNIRRLFGRYLCTYSSIRESNTTQESFSLRQGFHEPRSLAISDSSSYPTASSVGPSSRFRFRTALSRYCGIRLGLCFPASCRSPAVLGLQSIRKVVSRDDEVGTHYLGIRRFHLTVISWYEYPSYITTS
jgi:hypothetical protein